MTFNNSLIPGNFVVNPSGGGAEGEALAYDNRSADVYIGTEEDSLCVVSATTNEVVDIFEPDATVGYLTSIAYDYKDNEIFTEYTGTPGTVAVTSAATNHLVSSITIGDVDQYDTNALVYDNGTDEVFASNDGSSTVSVISTATNTVTTTISLPDEDPRALGYDSGTHQVFVANVAFGDNISVISDASNTVVKYIPEGADPDAFAYDSAKGYVYAANDVNPANVSVINDSTDTVLKSIKLTATATSAVYDPAQNEVYLTGANESVISDASNTLVATIALPLGALGAAYDPADDEIWVLDGIPGIPIYASAISATSNTVVANALLDFGSRYWAYDSAHQEEFLPDEVSSQVAVVSDVTDHVVAMISMPGEPEPYEAVYDSGKGEIFTADKASGFGLTVINDTTNTVVRNISLPGVFPTGMAYDPAKGEIFVGNAPGSNVTIVSDSSDSVVGVVSNVGTDPYTLAYDSGKGEIFAANLGALPSEANVTVINDTTDTIVASVNASGGPESGMIYDPAKGEIFLPEYSADTVSVISDATNKLVATIPTDTATWGAAYDPTADEVFVGDANGDYQNVTVISDLTDTTVGSIAPDGYDPGSLAFDPTTGDLYSGDWGDGTVGIITPQASSGPAHYAVTFTETGLPGGTLWSVTFNSTVNSSTTSSVGYSVVNGSYTFTVGTVTGYTPSPASGPVTVAGAAQTIPIVFTAAPPPTYTVTFETVPTTCSITFNGVTYTNGQDATDVAGGSYTLVAPACSGETFSSWSSTAGTVTSPTSASTTVTVSATGTLTATFTASVTTYTVTFETNPTSCSVGFDGTTYANGQQAVGVTAGAYPLVALACAGEVFHSWSSTAGTVASPTSGSTSVTVSSSGTITATFTAAPPVLYTVTFTETGLPTGTSWTVTLGGTPMGSTTETILFSESNDTYSFAVGAVLGYSASPSSGSVVVAGGPVSKTIAFTASTTPPPSSSSSGFLGLPGADGYGLLGGLAAAAVLLFLILAYRRHKLPITFTAVGLPPGTLWSVTLDDDERSAKAPDITFLAPTGPHSFRVGSPTGFTSTPVEGTLELKRARIEVEVTFARQGPRT